MKISPRLTGPTWADTIDDIPPSDVSPPMQIEAVGLTHVGMRRAHNEDNLLVMPEQRVFVVADGMGGHASGEVASKLAVEEMASFYLRTQRDEDATWPYRMDRARSYEENRLVTGVRLANLRIYELARTEARYQKMGTTIVALSFGPDGAMLAHVGDSRIYRHRNGELRQLTEDHSLLNDYIKNKKLTPEEIERFPHKNVIVRALGMADDVKVDLGRDEPRPGDQFLLCSDGLSGMISDRDIGVILQMGLPLERTAYSLIEAANAAGGGDNVTAIVVRIS